MKNWIDKTITLNDSWGPASKTILFAPGGGRPRFTLRARTIRNGGGHLVVAQLECEADADGIAGGWHGAIFTPTGSAPLTGVKGLQAFNPTTAKHYRDLLEGGTTNLGDSRTERLEGVVPYINASGKVEYDTVRLYFAENAVSGGSPHLVVVKTSQYGSNGQVKARQDGVAHGPPG